MCVRSRAQYFAEALYKSMKGMGTDDNTLIRIIVSRSEVRAPHTQQTHKCTYRYVYKTFPTLFSFQVDLVEIKRAFLDRYHKTLYKMVEGDTSGDYRRLLLAIIGRDV